MNNVSRCSGVKTAYRLKESIKKAPFVRMVLFSFDRHGKQEVVSFLPSAKSRDFEPYGSSASSILPRAAQKVKYKFSNVRG